MLGLKQLKVMQKELGDTNSKDDEIETFKKYWNKNKIIK